MPDDKSSTGKVDHRLIKRLAAILDETGLSEIEVETGDMRIRVARTLTAAGPAIQAYQALPAPTAAPAAAPAAASTTEPVAQAGPVGEVVKSPMVGTVFLQSQPGSEPFVRPGARVSVGQTLLIIEAMKTMNPIPAPRDGVVLEVLVGDSEPVEFGEPLVVLE